MQNDKMPKIESSPAIIYEVSIELERSIKAEYLEWSGSHISEVLRLPGFISAWVYEEVPSDENPYLLTIHYHVSNREDLARYFEIHAPRLRAEGEKLFGGRFKAKRRVLTLKSQYEKVAK